MITATRSEIDVSTRTDISEIRSIAKLVDKCRSGNREAQRQLYECYHQLTYRILVRMVGRTDADDVMQEVFLQVFRALSQFDGRSQFKTWIYRVTFNQALQHLRKRRRSRWKTLGLGGDVMEQKPVQRHELDDKELLESALRRLEPDLRAIFLLREVEKCSYSQIAEAIGVPEGTVASRLNRARQLLKQHLVELGWEP
jgi:RNA polymerase sigma-70 factor, ECF subfamily